VRTHDAVDDKEEAMRKFLLAVLGIACALTSQALHAQLAAKPVRLVVSLAPGGPSDSAARVVGNELSKTLGQPIIVENKPGADGALAAAAVLGSPGDGNTLFWSSTNALIGVPLLQDTPPYDPLTFTPVSLVGQFALFLFSHPSVPAQSLTELVRHARSGQETLNYATSTFGDVVAGAQLMKWGGFTMTRVPYKGAAQAIPDVIAGRVQLAIAPGSAGLNHVKEGRLRAIAVFLPSRNTVAPEVPAVSESGLSGFSAPWVGVFGPPKMPKDVVERLAKSVNSVLEQPEIRAQLERQGFQVQTSSPDALASYLKEDLERSKTIIREFGIAR
jgi:tripartite-type tricarboxylate transporter receptor subunit TctC